MKIIPSKAHRAERVLWIVTLSLLLLTALFMIGLWE
jgi:hypothetical protein